MFKRIAVISVFCLICFFFYGAFAPSGFWGHTENKQDVEVFIPQGTGLKGIAQKLEKEGALSHPWGFMVHAMLENRGYTLQAGEYLISPHMTLADLTKKMVIGDVIRRVIAVPEGVTVHDVISKLKDITVLEGEITESPQEGCLLPATYPYHRGEKRQDVLNRMIKAMEVTVETLWQNRSVHCPLRTREEAVIIASIIEKETSQKIEEQPRIAGVFYNRLYKEKMPLQSDPTVIYGLTKGQNPLGRPVLKKDLKEPSPYNTYLISGLPPTPIACPGISALKAALHPSFHEDIYFVADGTGGHVFGKTLEEHNKNVQKWRQINAAQQKEKTENVRG